MKIEVTGGEGVPEQHGFANKFLLAEGLERAAVH